MYLGIDIEQFVRDPYGSGIQRVLQYLAIEWPSDIAQADFVVPMGEGHGLLTPEQAARLLTVPFTPREPGADLRELVQATIAELNPTRVKTGDLVSIYDAWLLPEVSYDPSVLQRFEVFAKCMPTAMIGYDTLPMSEPANYRFKPGTAAWVSEYFRYLATADSVVCISEYAREQILGRLRRDPASRTSVAHPGGDHLKESPAKPPVAPAKPDSFVWGPSRPASGPRRSSRPTERRCPAAWRPSWSSWAASPPRMRPSMPTWRPPAPRGSGSAGSKAPPMTRFGP